MKMKDRIVAITSNFGLGPVGKLASIVNESKDDFEWYACGQEFDMSIFSKNIFKKILWTEKEEEIKEFVMNNNIKYALVVLKNRYARYLKSLGIKVVYVDSLPFMWTEKDAELGKVPYNMDVYCAQKSLELSEKSQRIFNNVKNLKWINPIVPTNTIEKSNKNKNNNSIIVNIGGLHSPVGNGEEYINVTVKPLIRILKKTNKNTNIIVTCGSKAKEKIATILKDYGIEVKTYEQKEFLKQVINSKMFFTSLGLTTLFETANLDKETIILPPQNLSQFYNVEYAKRIIHNYKILDWNETELKLEKLREINKSESEIVYDIYNNIKKLNNPISIRNIESNIMKILNEEYLVNKDYKSIESTGTYEVIQYIKEIIKNSNGGNYEK